MSTEARTYYPTNLTDEQWALIEPLLPEPKSGLRRPGCPVVDRRCVIDGILYVNKAGGQWRLLAREFGAWQTVYGYFISWSQPTVWQGLTEELTDAERLRQGRDAQLTGACLDSQSVKAASQPVEAVGFDGHKRVEGRKRHVLTDTLGLILFVLVTAANRDDRDGLRRVFGAWFVKGLCRVRKLWVDAGHVSEALRAWVRRHKRTHKIDLEVVGRQGKGFRVVPKRWVVERTFGWFLGDRRLSKDYEVLTRNSEAMIQIAMIAILMRRLT